MSDRLLQIYMNDQLAAGVLWREISRRAQRSNQGTELGLALERVSTAVAEDVETFEQLMDRLGFRRDRAKVVAAKAGERLGRLKLNGRLFSYSPLSRFAELDFLVMGIQGKKVLWANLRDLAGLSSRVPDVDFDALVARAQSQLDELEPFRETAGREALAG